jgi:hypothetical protein
VLPKKAPFMARSDGAETRTSISVRPVRPASTTPPSGRQAINLSASQTY